MIGSEEQQTIFWRRGKTDTGRENAKKKTEEEAYLDINNICKKVRLQTRKSGSPVAGQ